MAHPEEPTLPEDTGQRKNKNINNVHDDFFKIKMQKRPTKAVSNSTKRPLSSPKCTKFENFAAKN